MRVIIFLLLISFIIPTFSQTPSQKEMQQSMQQMMKKMNVQIADLEKQIAEAKMTKKDPESIKQMEAQLAMLKKQVETMGGISKMPGKIIQQATKDENNKGVPQKDLKRIKMLPDKILTDAELLPYVKKIHSEVEKLLPGKDKAEALKIYNALQSEKKSSNYIDNIASSLWLSGYPELALYILGKECTVNTKDANILNNYAAFLTMKGGEHAALPILQNLNNKIPNNSTILNNIGQAWYGLGEMNNAEKFFGETMHAYAMHSQANFTNARICLSQGRTEEAIESIKRSIHENYTGEKERLLNDAGGQLRNDDISFPYPGPAAPLGYEKFILTIPDYPQNGGFSAIELRMMWEDWRKKIVAAMEKLGEEIAESSPKAYAYRKKVEANSALLKPYNNKVHNTALLKLTLLIAEGSYRIAALGQKLRDAEVTIDQWREEYYKQPGDCGTRLSLAREFNSKANNLWHERNNELLTFLKQYLGEQARLNLYSCTDRSEYEQNIALIKGYFLESLNQLRCEFEVGCLESDPPENRHGKELPDFDEMNCQYKDEITIPPFTKMTFECNKMTTEFDIDTELGLKIKFGMEENLNSDKITKGTLEIGVEAGTDVAKFGPVGAELKGELGVGVEITSEGVQEVYIKGSSTIDVAGNIDDAEIIPGVQSDAKGLSAMESEVKVSWNVGSGADKGAMNSSLTGQGMLTPINISLK